ncbi:MAG: pore-forming ESAT-6 family protein [Longicatena sp.]
MDGLTITLSEVTNSASAIRQQNQQCSACLQEINQFMNQLSLDWQSPAGETLRTRFHTMLPVFEQYKTIVENYAKFLDQTVTSYQSLETQLNNHADSFK